MTADNKPTINTPKELFEYLLPTTKPHISFSELSDFIECSYRHKLKYIDQIITDKDGPSIHTEYGQTIHGAMEQWALQGERPRLPIEPEPWIKDFQRRLEALKKLNKEVLPKDEKRFLESIPGVLKAVPEWIDDTFPGWELVQAEMNLFEPIKEEWPLDKMVYFKGFVDLVIKVPDKKNPDKFIYHILDYKTTESSWAPSKKRDFNKQLQIILYKYFVCRLLDLDIKNVKCGFLLVKRRPNKKLGHCELVPVSVGPKTLEKGLKVLTSSVSQIKMGLTKKNKFSCRYCPYFSTKHCL